MPWMTAHRIECHFDHEMVMASALPNPIPLDATVFLVLIFLSPAVDLHSSSPPGVERAANPDSASLLQWLPSLSLRGPSVRQPDQCHTNCVVASMRFASETNATPSALQVLQQRDQWPEIAP